MLYFQRKWYLMIPWVVLGGMLAIGLLVSILMNSINFYLEGDTTTGTLWLVLGLISLGKFFFFKIMCNFVVSEV